MSANAEENKMANAENDTMANAENDTMANAENDKIAEFKACQETMQNLYEKAVENEKTRKDQLEKVNAEHAGKFDKLTEERDNVTEERDTLANENTSLKEDCKNLKEQMQRKEEEHREVEENLLKEKEALMDDKPLQREIQDLQEKLNESQQEIRNAQAHTATLQNEVAKHEDAYQTLEKQHAKMSEEKQNLEKRHAASKKSTATMQQQFQEEMQKQQGAMKQLKERLDSTNTKLKKQEEQNLELRKWMKKMEKENKELNKQNVALQKRGNGYTEAVGARGGAEHHVEPAPAKAQMQRAGSETLPTDRAAAQSLAIGAMDLVVLQHNYDDTRLQRPLRQLCEDLLSRTLIAMVAASVSPDCQRQLLLACIPNHKEIDIDLRQALDAAQLGLLRPVVVVLHHIATHRCPRVPLGSARRVTDTALLDRTRAIVDLVYWNNVIYSCDVNTLAIKELEKLFDMEVEGGGEEGLGDGHRGPRVSAVAPVTPVAPNQDPARRPSTSSAASGHNASTPSSTATPPK